MAPVEVEWPQRLELGRAIGKTEFDYGDMLRVSGGGRFASYHHRFMFGSVASHLAETFGTKGSPISLSTACASGATAIQLGVEAIRRGDADAALCVGTDGSVNPEALVRFSLLSALSTQNDPPQAASKPFSKNRDGFVMAEGAGAMVLESYEVGDRARREDPRRGRRLRRADQLVPPHPLQPGRQADHRLHAQDAGGCRPRSRNRSTTSTRTAPRRRKTTRWSINTTAVVFGEHLPKIPVSSNKSMVGHTISAAGAVEAVFSLLTLEHQRIPPTINYEIPDPAILFDVVGNNARDAKVTAVMSNSFGFGGQNASLILTREPV